MAFLLLYFLVERILLTRKIRQIPLRICVTGTRGKSTVTRLIAGTLLEDGLRVLAKTTGSKPVFIFPDGSEREIHRHGSPSILEAKNVLREAVEHKSQALVVELMSIQPELTFMESARIFRPHILVITNVRLDHTEQMGLSKREMAACFASAIPERCAVFVPEKENFPAFKEKADSVNSKISSVPKEAYSRDLEKRKQESPFAPDVQLALAVAESLDIERNTALAGMGRIQQDFGNLRIWASNGEVLPRGNCFVSAFAANDPESTERTLDFLKKKDIFNGKKRVALLNFREDRGDRTLQWRRVLEKGFLSEFDRVVLLGKHAQLVKKGLKSGFGLPTYSAWSEGLPSDITLDAVPRGMEAVVVGMGNMGGLGKELALYWEAIGEPYDL